MKYFILFVFSLIFAIFFYTAPQVAAQSSCSVTIPAGNPAVTFNATLPSVGDYYVYSRIKIPSTSNNSLWIVVNDSCPGSIGTSNINTWQWVPFGLNLAQTTANIKIASKQGGVEVDRIMIIPAVASGQAACVPVDKGDNCTAAVTVTASPGSCAKKNIGDADCKPDPQGKYVNLLDYAIWYSEFIKGCSSTNLAACGTDQDGDGNAMDANFNYPGTSYIATDTAVTVFDYAVWIQGYLYDTATPTTPGVTVTNPPTTQVPTSTIAPTLQASPTPTLILTPTGGGSAQYPAQVLNLTNWKITIPFDGPDEDTNADEVKQPALATYKDPNYFFVSPAGNSVIFRAHAGGATTGGSGYPRSELRERTNNGTADAGWSAGSGKHTMFIDQRVNKLPAVKQHIVVGQIHGGSDDLTVFRLEGTKLFIDINGSDGPVLTTNYQLGTRFTVKFEVEANKVKYYYNGALVPFTLNTNVSGAYFKAGAYTQSSCQGDKKVAGESCDAYGEVEIFDVQVTHN